MNDKKIVFFFIFNWLDLILVINKLKYCKIVENTF